jgi:arsenical pump membrane protein
MVRQAAEQSWPPFVLVIGLLLVGIVAHADGLFAAAGRRLQRLPGGAGALFAACLALLAVVTAVLNLDTAVVFLTPVLVLAARQRGLAEEPFLYASVFMANACSLYLPGSNLTNLLVLQEEPVSGGTFARHLFPAALAATVATAAGLTLLYRRQLHGGRAAASAVSDGTAERPLLSLVAIALVAVLTVALRQPALPVLAVGLVTVAVAAGLGRVSPRRALDTLGLPTLAALFAAAVALGTLARAWDAPGRLVAHAGAIETAVTGAVASVAVNNLPAAVLLSAHHLDHPRALLIGLNVGPSLAVTGALSALLWFRAAREVEARPSVAEFSRRGLVLAPLALAAALAAAGSG